MIIEGAIIYANILALLALGLTLTYITTNVPNFAQGSFAVVCSYVALTLKELFKIHPYISLPILFIVGAFVGLITYLLLKPLIKRGASIEMLMIATLAIDVIIFGTLGAYSEILSPIINSTAAKFIFSNIDFSFFGFKGVFLVSTIVVVLLLTLLYIMLYKTKFGVALRASMENPSLAQAMGIDVEKTRLFSWLISGGLAGIAGGLLPFVEEIVPGTGGFIIISIFAASIVGGLRHISGAILGGYIIGLSETLVTYGLSLILGAGFLVYGKVISLIIMIATLLLAPEGITGIDWKKVRKRLEG
ncbi:inner-membrane translocator [Methanocaldococcus villosus KIN24-T80]|uniref:Inner-membrane translocator n=1 Tax=Methanocaldococcus villosus KIN24-T80 TaxID=1069083 RepID=N6V3E7_9EURY|nr:branched-chain amino acid ABC transporter permease [Methanocaldococcus villosus]ENN96788.1 inner-membrane translocator [Methanocaldococcus villosus KIN24-T80]